jgi:hypothetical protein
MPRPSHPSWLDHSNYTWRRVQVMKHWCYCDYYYYYYYYYY